MLLDNSKETLIFGFTPVQGCYKSSTYPQLLYICIDLPGHPNLYVISLCAHVGKITDIRDS
jgi:hypothetical protein